MVGHEGIGLQRCVGNKGRWLVDFEIKVSH